MLSALELFIQKYPHKWKDILSKPPYNIIIKEDGFYTLLKYNQLAADTNWYDPIVQECRGIILNSHNQIVCHGFNRFFNLGEPYAAEIDWSIATITEKMDGSLIKIWTDGAGLHVSTNGTIDAFKVKVSDFMGNEKDKTYGDLVYEILGEDTLNKLSHFYKETIMFELISPYNRVVIDYGDEMSLYYLGSRDECGLEYYNEAIPKMQNVKTPKVYKLNTMDEKSVKDLVDTLEGHEGVVVKDAYSRRVKVKNITYFLKHRHLKHVSAEDMIEAIAKNEIEEFKTILPNEEYINKFDDIIYKCDILQDYVKDVVKENLSLNRKDFAIKFKNQFLFPLLIDCYLSGGEVVDLSKISAKKILKLLGGE